MLALLIVVAAFAVLAVLGPRYGVDSRPGFSHRNRRDERRTDRQVLSPTSHQFH